MNFDVIGDVHGELDALNALGRELGYDVDRDWEHPDGRQLIFLGDLVDRGAHSLVIAELVLRLHRSGRAICLMGNHEYNLVANHLQVPGYEKPKTSNAPTIAEKLREPQRWGAVLEFFRTLPIALEFEDLRLIHACWHKPSFESVRGLLAPRGLEGPFAPNVVLASPFDEHGLKAGLSAGQEDTSDDPPQEVLLKGFEQPAQEPFHDADGHLRDHVRSTWWLEGEASEQVAREKRLVVGHYWNLPPDRNFRRDMPFCPPHPSGHPELKRWQKEFAKHVSEKGRTSWDEDVACIDFNGVTAGTADRACVGALRWPESEIVWAMAPKSPRSVAP